MQRRKRGKTFPDGKSLDQMHKGEGRRVENGSYFHDVIYDWSLIVRPKSSFSSFRIRDALPITELRRINTLDLEKYFFILNI